jgi:uncharacterized protein YaaW (UPF0174 family)
LLTINKIIQDSFNDDGGMPKEIRDIVNSFLEVEDSNANEKVKDKMYEQILQNSLNLMEKNQRTSILEWCKDYY